MQAAIFSVGGSWWVECDGIHVATFSTKFKAVEFCRSQKVFYTSDK